jgi:F-type H+-transporting ATPase subunit gamma
MATLKQLRTRVSSIKNIQRVTYAMQLVAAARVRQAQDAILAARPYAEHLGRVLAGLHSSGGGEEGDHPLLRHPSGTATTVVVVTADRGLCGGFNGSVCRRAAGEVGDQEHAADLVTVGKKGRDYFNSRGYSIICDHADVFRTPPVFSRAEEIAADLTERFASGATDRVVLVFSRFQSLARQEPIARQLLPIVPDDAEKEKSGVNDYIFEPSPARLLEVLVPRYVNFQVWRALLESSAGEQAARMTAMDNASKNAGELIEELTQEMNKERQSNITLELMDIVGGAEAVSQS